MVAISIRGIDDKAVARLKHKAQQQGVSFNVLAARVLEAESGMHAPERKRRVFDDLDELAGTWKPADAKAFDAATAPFSEVDEALWK